MNLQQLFDKACSGVVGQGRPSMNHNGLCQYRLQHKANAEVKCAIGWLIPDEVYAQHDDFDTGASALQVLETVYGWLDQRTIDCLLTLQSIHDEIATDECEDFVSEFKRRAAQLALQYNLEVREPC